MFANVIQITFPSSAIYTRASMKVTEKVTFKIKKYKCSAKTRLIAVNIPQENQFKTSLPKI